MSQHAVLPSNLGSGYERRHCILGIVVSRDWTAPCAASAAYVRKKSYWVAQLPTERCRPKTFALGRVASSAPSRIFPTAQNGGGGGFWRLKAVRGVWPSRGVASEARSHPLQGRRRRRGGREWGWRFGAAGAASAVRGNHRAAPRREYPSRPLGLSPGRVVGAVPWRARAEIPRGPEFEVISLAPQAGWESWGSGCVSCPRGLGANLSATGIRILD